MFCTPGLVFGGIESVGSQFHVLRSQTHFLRYRQVPFNFLCARLFFDGTEGAVSRFHVLRSRTHFRRYQGVGYCFHVLRARTIFQRYRRRRVPFSCFARPDFFSTVPMASGPVFMFCAPGHVFGGIESVGSRFHVLRSRTSFRRYRGRRVPFTCFARPDSFSAVSRASGPVFMFYAPGLFFDGTEGVGSRLHVLRSLTRFQRYLGVGYRFHVFRARTRFRRYRGRRLPFSCFALPDSFLTVQRASCPVFIFCASGLVWLYRGCRLPFSCFSRPNSFSTAPRVSATILMFCAPELVFDGTEGVGSHFHVLRSQTLF
jgi:hypothetical protein